MDTKQVTRPVGELKPAGYNPRKITANELEKLTASIKRFGFVEPIVINADDTIIGGHQRLKAAIALGMTEVPCVQIDVPKEQEQALNLALNRIKGEWDEAKLIEIIMALSEEARKETGFDEKEIEQMLSKQRQDAENRPNLSDRFLIPPMSILDARQGYWQERKKKWLTLGIKSEEGRGENLLKFSDTMQTNKGLTFGEGPWEQGGTSIFDPVLCELAYRWYSPENGTVLDPFAGGSVRGIVAASLGRGYTGLELRDEQVQANRIQAKTIVGEKENLAWITGDSNKTLDTITDAYDLVFSCPPYADLEKYSDDPSDLSNMPYEDFLKFYREIIAKSCAKLKDNRFAIFVVGDIRDKRGACRNFVADTIQAFLDAGLALYNEAILITAYGSLPMRAGKQFETSRKLGKTHQNLLVFVKGDNIEESCQLMAPHFHEHRQLADHHEKVLIFSKGDPRQATEELGTIKVDSEAFVDAQAGVES